MRKKEIIITMLSAFLLTGCSALIYAIRGPKYKGKFKTENYLSFLEGQYFYYHYDFSEKFNDSLWIHRGDTTKVVRSYAKHTYSFLRFDNDGKIKVKSIDRDRPLEYIPSKSEIDRLPISDEIYYTIKDSLIKYEIYFDSYNGYTLYRAKTYADSIVTWEVGISKAFLHTYLKVKN